MPNDLQRIYDEVQVTVHSSRARDQSDVLNTVGSVLQFIVDKFGEAWPNWLLQTGSFTQSTQTKDLSAEFTPSLYAERVKDLWINNIGRIEGPFNIALIDPMLDLYPTGVPERWGWNGYQTIQFDYIPASYTVQCRYQRGVTLIDSSSALTTIPDIPGNDGFALLLEGVKAMLKLDTTAVDMLEQYKIWLMQWNSFFDRYAIEDEGQLELSYR